MNLNESVCQRQFLITIILQGSMSTLMNYENSSNLGVGAPFFHFKFLNCRTICPIGESGQTKNQTKRLCACLEERAIRFSCSANQAIKSIFVFNRCFGDLFLNDGTHLSGARPGVSFQRRSGCLYQTACPRSCGDLHFFSCRLRAQFGLTCSNPRLCFQSLC